MLCLFCVCVDLYTWENEPNVRNRLCVYLCVFVFVYVLRWSRNGPFDKIIIWWVGFVICNNRLINALE